MGVFKDVFGSMSQCTGTQAVVDPDFQDKHPILYVLLTSTVDDDGKRRQVCTLNLVCEDGMVKVGLRERDRGMSLWTSSETIDGAFAALDVALAETPSRWRKVDWKQGRKTA